MASVAPPSSPTIGNIRAALFAWYDANARALPWRAPPGEPAQPYRVWLSEIMLQQTTTAHAAPYFRAFVARWPTAAALAAAADEDVMAAWAGLGYYARARNLLACARAVAKAGEFPQTSEALRRLPGVGPYTAAAIAAIAFGEAAAVVDGNVERVIARLFAIETPLPAAKAELARLAGALTRPERPGDWAQAMMDLGATLCRPARPACDRCPLTRLCAARALGLAGELPRRSPKAERPQRRGVAFVLTMGGQVGLVRRPPRGLLGGMLGLPTSEWRARSFEASEALTCAPAQARWRPAGRVAHVFTHFALDLEVWRAEAARREPAFIWTDQGEAASALPSVFAKALALARTRAPS